MAIMFVIAWPISKLLDCLLGKEHSTFYRRSELRVLVDLHSKGPPNLHHDDDSSSNEVEDPLSTDEVLIIQGVLDMKNKTVKHAMISMDTVFMLNVDDVLDKDTMRQVGNLSNMFIVTLNNLKIIYFSTFS